MQQHDGAIEGCVARSRWTTLSLLIFLAHWSQSSLADP